MLLPSFEVLLPIGAIGLYLYDATLLLYGNELVLEGTRTGWRASLGGGLQLGGRRTFLPDVLAPGRPLFRSTWSDTARPESRDLAPPEQWLTRLRPLQFIVTVQAVLLLFVLPPVSILLGAGSLLLMLFTIHYTLIVAAAYVLLRRRRDFQLGLRQVAWLSFESALCAPFALNLVRKVTLANSGRVDWSAIATVRMTSEARTELLQRLGARIDELQIPLAEGSAAHTRLEAVRADVKERLHVPVVE